VFVDREIFDVLAIERIFRSQPAFPRRSLSLSNPS
jgi:hypothetical protein